MRACSQKLLVILTNLDLPSEQVFLSSLSVTMIIFLAPELPAAPNRAQNAALK